MRLIALHGGIWENMTAERFWHRPGITTGLEHAGLTVTAPDRLRRPLSWSADTAAVQARLPRGRFTLLGASNANTAAIRLAARYPRRVNALILAWPATRGHDDDEFAAFLTRQGARNETITDLTTGQTLRGVTDSTIATLPMPVAIVPAPPQSHHHRPETVTALRRLLPHAAVLPETPEPPRPDFPAHRDRFIHDLTRWITDHQP